MRTQETRHDRNGPLSRIRNAKYSWHDPRVTRVCVINFFEFYSLAATVMTTISVTVKCSTGDKFTIDVDTKLLVSDFKALLSDKAKIPATQQRLIFSGHVLKDPQALESYCM